MTPYLVSITTITKLVPKCAQGINEQPLKTSVAEVLSSRKGEWGVLQPPPPLLYVRGLNAKQDDTKIVSYYSTVNYDVRQSVPSHCRLPDTISCKKQVVVVHDYLIFQPSSIFQGSLTMPFRIAKL